MVRRPFFLTISSGVALDKFDTCTVASCEGSGGAFQIFHDSANIFALIGDGTVEVALSDGSFIKFRVVDCNAVFEDGICRIDCADYQRL